MTTQSQTACPRVLPLDTWQDSAISRLLHRAGRAADARDRWVCPDCGSDALSVYYTEQHVCTVVTGPDGSSPWPSYRRDEYLVLDADCFRFCCDGCLVSNIAPVLAHDGAAETTKEPDADSGHLV